MTPRERLAYDHARALWHANIGPIRTPGVGALFEALEEIVGANRQDGDKVKPTAVLDALPGLGKTTAALAFGQAFHRAQIECYGPHVDVGGGRWQRIPVVYVGPHLEHDDAEPERHALPLLRPAGRGAGHRRLAGAAGRRVRRQLQDPPRHRRRRPLLGREPTGRPGGGKPLQVARQHLPGHLPLRRGGTARPRTIGRGTVRGRRRVLPDGTALERVEPRSLRGRHQGRTGHLAPAPARHRTRAGARPGAPGHGGTRAVGLPLRPLQRALRLAHVAHQPRLLPGGQDRDRGAHHRAARHRAHRPGRRGGEGAPPRRARRRAALGGCQAASARGAA